MLGGPYQGYFTNVIQRCDLYQRFEGSIQAILDCYWNRPGEFGQDDRIFTPKEMNIKSVTTFQQILGQFDWPNRGE